MTKTGKPVAGGKPATGSRKPPNDGLKDTRISGKNTIFFTTDRQVIIDVLLGKVVFDD